MTYTWVFLLDGVPNSAGFAPIPADLPQTEEAAKLVAFLESLRFIECWVEQAPRKGGDVK